MERKITVWLPNTSLILTFSDHMQEEGGNWECEPRRSDQPSLPATAPVCHHSKLDLYELQKIFVHPTKLDLRQINVHVCIREAPHKDTACSNGILPDSVSTPQRPKKSQLSGWQTFMRKNFPDEVRIDMCAKSAYIVFATCTKVSKLFSRHILVYRQPFPCLETF